jgi:hypothetical protein
MTATVVSTLDDYVTAYIKLRDKKSELAAAFAEKEQEINRRLDIIKGQFLEHCKDNGVESVKTSSGTFWRSQKTRFWTGDWEAFNNFVVKHEAVDLLEKRIHQGNMKQFLEENPEALPPGLNADSEYTITVRRKK